MMSMVTKVTELAFRQLLRSTSGSSMAQGYNHQVLSAFLNELDKPLERDSHGSTRHECNLLYFTFASKNFIFLKFAKAGGQTWDLFVSFIFSLSSSALQRRASFKRSQSGATLQLTWVRIKPQHKVVGL